MKYLIAFALVAVAAGLPEHGHLLQPVQIAQPDIAPLMVPQEVMDQVATQVKFVDAPETAGPVDAVNIVDAPVENDASDFAVNFVEAPEIAEAPVAASAVNFVDNADVDEETPSYIDAPFQIKIADMPLPDSVVMPLVEVVPLKIEDAAVDTNADFAVKIVDVAEDTPVYMAMRPKQYPDPMWR